MVEQYLRFVKKQYNIQNKKADLESIIREYEIDLNKLDEKGQSLLNLIITEEDLDLLDLVLKLPDDFKSKSADPN